MPARSFIGEMEEAARRFYSTMLRGEVSDANVRGYLRAASQIAEVWEQIDVQIAELVSQGAAPWEAYKRFGEALAFVRAARAFQVFVQELLAADAAADPATCGFLPRITYDQANALAHQIQPNLQRAIATMTDASYQPDVALPLALEPRIETEGACPETHLAGMISAAQEVREWAAGLIAQYAEAVRQATSSGASSPPAVTDHLVKLHSHLVQADAQLRFGIDLIGQASHGEATPELREQGEESIWAALEAYFLLNQAVALPELLRPNRQRDIHPATRADESSGSSAAPSGADHRAHGASHGRHYEDRLIHPNDLWRIAAPSARSELRRTPFGRDEMNALCEQMNGVLTAKAQKYLDDVEAAVQRGDVITVGSMSSCPFEPLYRTRRPLNLCGARIPAGHEFHWNYQSGRLETATRFDRVNTWQGYEE